MLPVLHLHTQRVHHVPGERRLQSLGQQGRATRSAQAPAKGRCPAAAAQPRLLLSLPVLSLIMRRRRPTQRAGSTTIRSDSSLRCMLVAPAQTPPRCPAHPQTKPFWYWDSADYGPVYKDAKTGKCTEW